MSDEFTHNALLHRKYYHSFQTETNKSQNMIDNQYEALIVKNKEIKEYIDSISNSNELLIKENCDYKEQIDSLRNKIKTLLKSQSKDSTPTTIESYYSNALKTQENTALKITEINKKYNSELNIHKREHDNAYKNYEESLYYWHEDCGIDNIGSLWNYANSWYEKVISLTASLRANECSDVNFRLSYNTWKEENKYIRTQITNETGRIEDLIHEIMVKNTEEMLRIKYNYYDNVYLTNKEMSSVNNENNIIQQEGIIGQWVKNKEVLIKKNIKLNNDILNLTAEIGELSKKNGQLIMTNIAINERYEILLKEKNMKLLEITSLNNEKQNLLLKCSRSNNPRQLNNHNIGKCLCICPRDLININQINPSELNEQTWSEDENKLLKLKFQLFTDLRNENENLKSTADKVNAHLKETEADLLLKIKDNIQLRNEIYSNTWKIKSLKEEINNFITVKDTQVKHQEEFKHQLNSYKCIVEASLKRESEWETSWNEIKNQNLVASATIEETKTKNENWNLLIKKMEIEWNWLRTIIDEDRDKLSDYDEKLTTWTAGKQSIEWKYKELYEEHDIIIKVINKMYHRYQKSPLSNEIYTGVYDQINELDKNFPILLATYRENKVLLDKVNVYETEIKQLKNRIEKYSSLTSRSNVQYNQSHDSWIFNLPTLSQAQLNEKIIKYIRDWTLNNEIQIYRLILAHEEQWKMIFSNHIDYTNDEDIKEELNKIKKNIQELINHAEVIERNTKQNSEYLDKRIKQCVNVVDIKTKIEDLHQRYENEFYNWVEHLLSFKIPNYEQGKVLTLRLSFVDYDSWINKTRKNMKKIFNNVINWWGDFNSVDNKVDSAFDVLVALTYVKSEMNNNSSLIFNNTSVS